MPGGSNPNYAWGDLAELWSNVTGQKLGDNTTAFAASVAQAESSGKASVVSAPNSNGTVDIGLWQINSSHIGQQLSDANGPFTIQSQQWLQDPANNTRTAFAMSNAGTDWHAWCTAYSDGACGTKGGTYLGAGSPAVKNYQSATGAVTSGSGLIGTLTLGGAGSGATGPPDSSTGNAPQQLTGNCDPKNTVWKVGPFSVLNECQAQGLEAGALQVAGGLVMLIGTIVILFRFQGTRQVAETVAAVPIAGRVAKIASGRSPGPRRASAPRRPPSRPGPRREPPMSDQDYEDANSEMRYKRMQAEGELGPRGGATPKRRAEARKAMRGERVA